MRPYMGLAYSWSILLIATVAYIVVLAPRQPPAAQPLCDSTRAFLQGMNQKMFVDVYAVPVDGATRAAADHVVALMGRYREAAAGKLSFDVFREDDDATRGRAATEHVFPEDYAAAAGEKKQALLGIAFTYAGEHDVIAFVPPAQADTLEVFATQKMEELVRRAEGPKVRVGVVVGHGEVRLDAPDLVPGGAYTMAGIVAQSFPWIELVEVELSRPVDASLDGLLVQQPQVDYTDDELARIDDFVMKGKTLAVFAGAVNVRPGDATMAATIASHGLSRLTGGYGIGIADDVVFDFGEYYESPELAGLPARRFPDMPLVVDRAKPDDSFLDPAFLPFAPLHGIVLPFASSLVLAPDKQPQAKIRVVARTSPHASHVTDAHVSLDPERDFAPFEGRGRFDLGAVAVGTLHSAFAAGRTSEKPARVLVLSSAAFMANPFVRAGEGEALQQIGKAYAKALVTPLALTLEATLEWAATSPGEAACHENILRRGGK
jgi:hypothetical protein